MSEFLLYVDRKKLYDRIMSKVIINPVTGCWIYVGHDDGKGYKKVSIMGNSYYVHRIMYILLSTLLQLPHLKPRHDLDHVEGCVSRSCCNPMHMKPLTRLAHNRKTHKRKRRWHLKKKIDREKLSLSPPALPEESFSAGDVAGQCSSSIQTPSEHIANRAMT